MPKPAQEKPAVLDTRRVQAYVSVPAYILQKVKAKASREVGTKEVEIWRNFIVKADTALPDLLK